MGCDLQDAMLGPLLSDPNFVATIFIPTVAATKAAATANNVSYNEIYSDPTYLLAVWSLSRLFRRWCGTQIVGHLHRGSAQSMGSSDRNLISWLRVPKL